MKYFLSLTLTFLAVSSQLSFACHDKDKNGTIEDYEVEQYIEELSYLSNGLQRNKVIEKCYLNNKRKLKFHQVEMLLGALYDDRSNNYYDDDETQNRIASDYFDINMRSVGVELASRIASKQSSGLIKNKQIELYIYANMNYLSWHEITYLLMNLYNDKSANYYDDDEAQNRIAKRYMELRVREISPLRAVEVAKKQSSGLIRNKQIEKYFMDNKYDLSWSDVTVLLSGLYNDQSSNYYDDDETQDRIVEEWNNCQ